MGIDWPRSGLRTFWTGFGPEPGPKVQVRVHVSGWTGPPSRVQVQHLG